MGLWLEGVELPVEGAVQVVDFLVDLNGSLSLERMSPHGGELLLDQSHDTLLVHRLGNLILEPLGDERDDLTLLCPVQ